MENASVDFVYSFIVLQHLPTLQSLKDYIEEIRRVMKSQATGILYFGFLPGRFRQKYFDLSKRKVDTVREITLQITIPLARKLLRASKFRIIEVKRSYKKPWKKQYGGQFYAIIQKEGN